MNRSCMALSSMVLALAGPAIASIDTSDPYLAGPSRNYHQTSPPMHFDVAGSFFDVFCDFDVQSPTNPVPPAPFYGPPLGTTAIRESPTIIKCGVSLNGLPPGEPVIGSFFDIFYSQVAPGTFNTEMLSFNFSGVSPFGPFMIRESPTRQSLGRTSVTPLGGGTFRIDSFFDVFTELSIDGGQSWIPEASNVPAHFDLLPAPGAACLLGLAGLAAGRRRRA